MIRGGLEMLFSDQRQHALKLPSQGPDGKPVNIAFLIDYLCENVMQDTRKELFVLDNHLYVSTHLPIMFSYVVHCSSTPLQRGHSQNNMFAPVAMIWHVTIRSLASEITMIPYKLLRVLIPQQSLLILDSYG